MDSYISDSLKEEEKTDEKLTEEVKASFEGILEDGVVFKVESLKSDKIPALFVLSEEGRRMQEMAKMFGNNMNMPNPEEAFVVNSTSPVIKKALELEDKEIQKMVLSHIYDMAKLSYKNLTGDEMNAFLNRSAQILEKIM